MIQRIQTVWLLLASIICSGLFFFDLYRADVIAGGQTILNSIRVNDHYPSLLIALVVTVLPVVSIFMYKNRKRQRLMAVICIIINVSFISSTLMRVGNYNSQATAPANGTYWIGSVLPVIAIIFLIMAIRGINKDEKLVKSLDRLR